jgi:hypothetical protein
MTFRLTCENGEQLLQNLSMVDDEDDPVIAQLAAAAQAQEEEAEAVQREHKRASYKGVRLSVCARQERTGKGRYLAMHV